MLKARVDFTRKLNDSFRPLIYHIGNVVDKKSVEELLQTDNILIYDEIYDQVKELVKSRHPSVKLKDADYKELIPKHLGGTPMEEYGVWVYYPWSFKLVHMLDEKEFIEVRTNRNKYKITENEQMQLATKTIGVVGLSVGQSIAITLAMERVCGHIKLADFDTAELSNLNRLRTGLHNLGLRKTVIAAREIAEIDPYLKVTIFNDGLTDANINDFFTKDGKLDILVEVCDGLDIKVISRFKARELRIPVVMDTNDRGMMDVERFDLEPERAIFHGLAGDLDPSKIKGLSNEDKVPYILKMIGAETISTRLKASMMEVEQSINTWPQLASSVTLGGGLTTDVCRRILLDQYHDSGRYYVDLDVLIADKGVKEKQVSQYINPFRPLEKADMEKAVDQYFKKEQPGEYILTADQVARISDAARIAPSAGNNQPWKWIYRHGVLFLFHDQYRSWSWGDYAAMGSFMSLGTSIENVHLQAAALHLEDQVTLLPADEESKMVATIRFKPSLKDADITTLSLADNLYKRHTNRNLGIRKKLPADFYSRMQNAIGQDTDVRMFYTDDDAELSELGRIIAACDKVRLLQEQGHEEFYSEIRWDKEQATQHNDGVELASVDLTQSEIAGFKVARDWNAVKLLSQWDKGDAFMKLSTKAVDSASSIVVFAVPAFNSKELITGGRAVERAWIYANANGVSVHPILSSAFFFSRLVHGNGIDMPAHVVEKLKTLREKFSSIFKRDFDKMPGYSEIFLMKLAIAEDVTTRSLRKPKDEVFY